MILALDVSGSMCATDVEPNRLTAAQTAVRDFVQAQDGDTRIGLVLFAGFAQVAVAPTTGPRRAAPGDRHADHGPGHHDRRRDPQVGRRHRRDQPGRRPRRLRGPRAGPRATRGPQAATHRRSSCCSPTAPTPGASSRSTRRRSPPSVGCGCTRSASERGTRRRWCARRPSSAGGASRAAAGYVGGGLSGRNYLVADEATLQQVADVTGGQYFAAADADRLQRVLADLPRTVQTQHRDVEVSVWLAGLAALLLLGSMWAAARWTAFPA